MSDTVWKDCDWKEAIEGLKNGKRAQFQPPIGFSWFELVTKTPIQAFLEPDNVFRVAVDVDPKCETCKNRTPDALDWCHNALSCSRYPMLDLKDTHAPDCYEPVEPRTKIVECEVYEDNDTLLFDHPTKGKGCYVNHVIGKPWFRGCRFRRPGTGELDDTIRSDTWAVWVPDVRMFASVMSAANEKKDNLKWHHAAVVRVEVEDGNKYSKF